MTRFVVALALSTAGWYFGGAIGLLVAVVLSVPLFLAMQAREDHREVRRALDRPPPDDDRY